MKRVAPPAAWCPGRGLVLVCWTRAGYERCHRSHRILTASTALPRHPKAPHGTPRRAPTAPTALPWHWHGSHGTLTASSAHMRHPRHSGRVSAVKSQAGQARPRVHAAVGFAIVEIHRLQFCWPVQGQADHEVLEVFRSAYEEVKRGYNDQLINERKTNLAALLLDIANKEGNPSLCPQFFPQADLGFAPSAPYQSCRGARRAATKPLGGSPHAAAPCSAASSAEPPLPMLSVPRRQDSPSRAAPALVYRKIPESPRIQTSD